jgi:uncharacterized protein (DUF433 family)
MALRVKRRSRKILTRKELFSRIVIKPETRFGKPCIRGNRIWVSLVLDLLASSVTAPEIIGEYSVED